MADKQFPNKYLTKLTKFAEGYTDTADGADTEELKKFVLTAERNIYEIEHERDNNANIVKMKEDLKEITGPFSEAKSIETAKIKYACWLLDQRGVKN